MIATLKLIGTPDRQIGGLIIQQSLRQQGHPTEISEMKQDLADRVKAMYNKIFRRNSTIPVPRPL